MNGPEFIVVGFEGRYEQDWKYLRLQDESAAWVRFLGEATIFADRDQAATECERHLWPGRSIVASRAVFAGELKNPASQEDDFPHMSLPELDLALQELHLTQQSFAELIGVHGKTVERWFAGRTRLPGPCTRLVRAWLRLERSGIGWRPDVMLLGFDDFGAIRRHLAIGRRHGRGFVDK